MGPGLQCPVLALMLGHHCLETHALGAGASLITKHAPYFMGLLVLAQGLAWLGTPHAARAPSS